MHQHTAPSVPKVLDTAAWSMRYERSFACIQVTVLGGRGPGRGRGIGAFIVSRLVLYSTPASSHYQARKY